MLSNPTRSRRPRAAVTRPKPARLVLDASVAINLVATPYPFEILEALGEAALAPDEVIGEVDRNPRPGSTPSASPLAALIATGRIERVSLTGTMVETFVDLAGELGDGESATIAIAIAIGGVAVVDERKARGLCGRRFPGLRLGSSVGLLRHPRVADALGDARQAEAVFDALRFARMRVLPEHDAWVRRVLGDDRVKLCPSLKSRSPL